MPHGVADTLQSLGVLGVSKAGRVGCLSAAVNFVFIGTSFRKLEAMRKGVEGPMDLGFR